MDFPLSIQDVNEGPGADAVLLGEAVLRVAEIGPWDGVIRDEGSELRGAVVVDPEDGDGLVLEFGGHGAGDFDDALGV